MRRTEDDLHLGWVGSEERKQKFKIFDLKWCGQKVQSRSDDNIIMSRMMGTGD